MTSSPHNFKTQLSIASNLDSDRSRAKSDRIHDLYSKFASLNSQVTIDHDMSAFNLIEFNRKDLKIEYDQQMVIAKLKRLQNNAELRRIDMELQNRKKKLSHRQSKQLYPILPQKQKYINTYRHITQNKIQFGLERGNHTDSDDEEAQTQRPKGITYFNELKKHPKLLKYTVQQVKSKQKLKLEQINAKKQKIQQFKNQLKLYANKSKNNDRSKQKNTNPQRVAENIIRRFYVKKNTDKAIQQAKNDGRVSSFIDKQQSIINTIDERSLSKQNYAKLKQKMNDIASQIYSDQKKHKSKTKLPKINRTTFITIHK